MLPTLPIGVLIVSAYTYLSHIIHSRSYCKADLTAFYLTRSEIVSQNLFFLPSFDEKTAKHVQVITATFLQTGQINTSLATQTLSPPVQTAPVALPLIRLLIRRDMIGARPKRQIASVP